MQQRISAGGTTAFAARAAIDRSRDRASGATNGLRGSTPRMPGAARSVADHGGETPWSGWNANRVGWPDQLAFDCALTFATTRVASHLHVKNPASMAKPANSTLLGSGISASPPPPNSKVRTGSIWPYRL